MNKKVTTTTSQKKDIQTEKVTVYHNTRCSKSRETCSFLEEKQVPFNTVEYLKNPLSKAEIKALLKKLNMKAEDLVRKNEPIFKEKFAKKSYTEEQWVELLELYPVLIQRPIVVKGDKAVIGRPLENILEII